MPDFQNTLVHSDHRLLPQPYDDLTFWIDGDARGHTTPDGTADRIESVKGKSRNGRIFDQSTPSNRPDFLPNRQARKSAIRFTANSEKLINTGGAAVIDTGSPFTHFVALKENARGSFRVIHMFEGDTNLVYLASSLGAYGDYGFGMNVDWYDGQFASGEISAGTAYIVTLVFDGVDSNANGSFAAYVNGVSKTISASSSYSSQTGDTTFGADSTSSNGFDGDIYESVLWGSKELTTAELNREGRRLSKKWDIPWTDI